MHPARRPPPRASFIDRRRTTVEALADIQWESTRSAGDDSVPSDSDRDEGESTADEASLCDVHCGTPSGSDSEPPTTAPSRSAPMAKPSRSLPPSQASFIGRRRTTEEALSDINWESTEINVDESDRNKWETNLDELCIGCIGELKDISEDEAEKKSDIDDSSMAEAAARARRFFCQQVNDDSSASGATRDKRALRRLLLVFALVIGASVGASVVIVFLVTDGDPLARRSAALHLQEAQHLLELAESIVVACSDPTNDECPALCDANMCCIDHGDPCGDGIRRECAVYAGCRALLDLRRA